jgi:hypothetical protein
MLRKKLLKKYQKKWEGIMNMDGRICPKILARLDELAHDASHCYGVYAGDGFFEIIDKQKQYVVNLLIRTCGCRQWDVTCIPCHMQYVQYGLMVLNLWIMVLIGILWICLKRHMNRSCIPCLEKNNGQRQTASL